MVEEVLRYMKNLNEVRSLIDQHRKELEDKFKIKSIAIFGSYSRGEQQEKSDIDVLVEFKEPVSLLHIVSTENYLSDLLGIKVDLVPKRNIREELRDLILNEAIPL